MVTERIVEEARRQAIIKSTARDGVQAGLDELLTKTEDFRIFLQQELAQHSLHEDQVLDCLHLTYNELSKVAHGNTGLITLYHEDHEPAEIAAMVIILRIQEQWPNSLNWREIEKR